MIKVTRMHKSRSISVFCAVLSLLFVMLLALGAISYAWFRNIVEVDGANLTTGNFQYQFAGYHKLADGTFQNDFAYSTKDISGFQPIPVQQTVEVAGAFSMTISPQTPGEVYYLFRALPESINLDVSVKISTNYDTMSEDEKMGIGGFWYTIDTVLVSPDDGQISTFDFSRDEMDRLMSAMRFTSTDVQDPLYNLDKDLKRQTLTKSEYWCVRVSYGTQSGAISHEYADKNIVITPHLCVAQVGGLEGDSSIGKTFDVRRLLDLELALANYTTDSEIRILSDVIYEGDLIFNRPVTLRLQGATLTVKGDMRMTSTVGGAYTINTSQNGCLEITSVNDVGGNLRIELPSASVNFVGRNLEDVIVEGNVYVEASYEKGMLVNRSRIVDRSGNLKQLYLRGSSMLEVAKYSEVNTVSVHDAPLRAIRIINHGAISGIVLTQMVEDTTYIPSIDIENHASIQSAVMLPLWSTEHSAETPEGNTKILRYQGADSMSVGSGGSFTTENIDYKEREVLIDKVEGDTGNVIVHYLVGENGQISESLGVLLNRYADMSDTDPRNIDAPNQIHSMKVICYGARTLTTEDYEFIRTSMTALTTLDLSEAASTDYTVPNNAFNGASSLTTVHMPEVDTKWGSNLFAGTSVTDIRIPLLAVTMNRDTFTTGTASSVKYIHVTQTETVLTLPSTSYVFVPDKASVSKYNSSNKKVFVEAERCETVYGDFFVRFLGGSIEFVTYAGNHEEWYRAFDKNPIQVTLEPNQDYVNRSYLRVHMGHLTLNGMQYPISTVDDYAFYNLFSAEENVENAVQYYVDLEDTVTHVGDYAFGNTTMVVGVEGEGVVSLGNYSFDSCPKLVRLVLPSLTTLSPSAGYAIRNCDALNWVETGVLNKKLNASAAYALMNSAPSLNIYIMHSTGTEDLDLITAHTITYANASNYVCCFIPQNVASLYPTNTTKKLTTINLGDISSLDYYPVLVPGDIFTVPKFVVGNHLDHSRNVIACTSDRLEASDVFTDYPDGVTHIGDYVFKNIPIYSITPDSVLRFPDCVTHVGVEAFIGSNKNFYTLELNQVEAIQRRAFESNQIVEIKGAKVHTLGDMAFYKSAAYTVELPSWRYAYPKQTTWEYYFSSCTNLRYAYLGPLDSIGTWAFYLCTNLRAVYIDATDRDPNAAKVKEFGWYNRGEEFTAFVAGGKSVLEPYREHNDNRYELVVDSFDDFVFADFETLTVTVGNVSGVITTPQSVAVAKDDGTMAYQKYLGSAITGDYTTPAYLYAVEGQNTFFLGQTRQIYTLSPNGSQPLKTFTEISKSAYFGVDFDGDAKITIAPTVTTIGIGAFKQCVAKEVDLSNVQTLDSNCFESARLDTLTAESVKTIGNACFSGCINLASVRLPALEKATGSNHFNGNIALTDATLGRNTTDMGSNMFSGCTALTSVMLQALTPPAATNPFPTSETLTLSLRKSAGYITGTVDNWKGVPVDRIKYFDNVTIVDNVEFYWDIVSEASNEVEIITVLFPNGWVGPENKHFVIPHQFTETLPGEAEGEEIQTTYTVVSLTEATIQMITKNFAYTDLTIPSAIRQINFSQESLSPTLQSFHMSATVEGYTPRFSVRDGVLYNYDETMLLIYPQNRVAEGQHFDIPSTVTVVMPNAFIYSKLKTVSASSRIQFMEGAFASCAQLTSLTLSNEAGISLFAGRAVFKDSSAMEKIYVPSKLLTEYELSMLLNKDMALLLDAIPAQAQ